MNRLLLCLVLLVGCTAETKPKPNPEKFPYGWTLVNCSECDGKGKVTYGKDHWIVVNGFSDPGTFECPMCQGEGTLYQR